MKTKQINQTGFEARYMPFILKYLKNTRASPFRENTGKSIYIPF